MGEGDAVSDFPCEFFGGLDGEVAVGGAAEFFPDVGRTGFEAEFGGVVLDEIVAGSDGRGETIGEVSHVVVEEARAEACEAAVAEEAIVLSGGAEELGGGGGVGFAVAAEDIEEGFVVCFAVSGVEGGGDEEIVSVAGVEGEADGGGVGPAHGVGCVGGLLFLEGFACGWGWVIGDAAEGVGDGGHDGEVIAFLTCGWGIVVGIADEGIETPVAVHAEVEASVGDEVPVVPVFGFGDEGDGLGEFDAVVEFVGEALGEADGEVVVLDAALFFPEVAWAGFEGEGGGVVFDGVEAEGGADIDAVVEVSDAVVPCVGEDTCVERAAERVVP